ncbi:hypothetical protein [Pseudomonas luteola]|nr:hypothetical protein [Pseudomonas luteola]QEU28876.1 hypothetical protein FOB45_14260 [Pseudomonas luteola]
MSMREEFEKYCREDMGWSDDDLKTGLYRDTYFWQKTADAWEIWQASRATLSVKSCHTHPELILTDEDRAYEQGVQNQLKAIKAAGITVVA